MRWGFQNSVEIHFGDRMLSRLGELVTGGRTLLVTSPGFARRGLVTRVRSELPDVDLVVHDSVSPNPELTALEATIERLKPEGITQVIAMGGGSVMDSGKILALFLSPENAGLSLEGTIGQAQRPDPSPLKSLPLLAVPTTAGTGAEVTPFATVWDATARKKLSLAAKALTPQIALLDPSLTLNLPWDQTLFTGLDALSQALESIWNRHASPISLAMAYEAVAMAMTALPSIQKEPTNLEHRSLMLTASLMAGLCISQTRTALAHSISYPLTAHLGMPHGLACGFLLPEVLRFNREADDGRLRLLANRLGLRDIGELDQRLETLLRTLGAESAAAAFIRGLDTVEPLIPEMMTPGRAENNLRPADGDSVAEILSAATVRLVGQSPTSAR